MSIKLMTMVWEKYPASGSELLAMLALADWAGDDGGSLYPSMSALAAKIRLSEKQARRIVQDLVHQGILLVVGNEHGGAPGTTKQFRLNVRKLEFLPDLPKKLATKKSAESLPSAFETAPADVTPPVNVTPPAGVRDGSHPCPSTPPTGVPRPLPPVGAKPSVEPSIEPPYNRHISPVAVAPVAGPVFPPIDDIVVKQAKPAPVGTVAVVEAAEVVEHTPTAKPKRKRTVVGTGADETALQAACRTTWAAYSGAYAIRYGVAPLRNAKVNAAIKGFVQRIGHDESPAVAAYYVSNVNDAFVVRNMHDTGLLLKQAEGYRTQWATGRSVTATAARQADQTAANLSVVEEAKLIARARRAAREAARLAGEDFL